MKLSELKRSTPEAFSVKFNDKAPYVLLLNRFFALVKVYKPEVMLRVR
jgi:hypothetical protein